jgi:hypothetical protein
MSFTEPGPPTVVPYLSLGGGLNTTLDPHALTRNELAVSVNLWPSYAGSVAKRPGSVPLITKNGYIGGGTQACMSLSTVRFGANTWLIVMTTDRVVRAANIAGTSWQTLGTAHPDATFLSVAQMFNPATQAQTAFICDGFSVPQEWQGPGHPSMRPVPITPGKLPSKYNSPGVPITPQFVRTLGNNANLFYSGDSSNPSAVYVSDPFFPEDFTSAAMQVTTDPTIGAYIPAIIGNNDGVEGGAITGLETLASVMVVFKEAAIYAMVQTTLLGEIPAWQVVEISNSVGCQAPRSIARFDTFLAFLGIDGVYTTDAQGVQQISGDVATYFDASLTGFASTITNRYVSIGVRHGQRYLLFFSIDDAPVCKMGMWFDFTKPSRFGNPQAGQIADMLVGGAASLRGLGDDGNVAWGEAVGSKNRIGRFGVGHADFGKAITTLFAGKADLFDDVFGPSAAIAPKQAQDAYALIELVDRSQGVEVDFQGAIIVDLSQTLARVIKQAFNAELAAATWGENFWGEMLWGSSTNALFGVVKIPLQNDARGVLLQLSITERSTVPWVCLGYALYVNPQRVSY